MYNLSTVLAKFIRKNWEILGYIVLAKFKGSLEQEKSEYTVYIHHVWRDKNFHLQQTCINKACITCISMFLGLKHTSMMLLLWLSESFVEYMYSAGQIYKVIWVYQGILTTYGGMSIHFSVNKSHLMQVCSVLRIEKKLWWHIQCWLYLNDHLNMRWYSTSV